MISANTANTGRCVSDTASFPSEAISRFAGHTHHHVCPKGATTLHSQLQSPSSGQRRALKYAPARAPLPAPAGHVGGGGTRASLELIADLRVLTNAGLIEPFLDGRTIRYAAVDANQKAPTPTTTPSLRSRRG